MSFLFFPPACITQVGENSFRINDIYGGTFNVNKDIASVYLSQDHNHEPKQQNRLNMPIDYYDSIIDALIKNKIIYKTIAPKEKPFDGIPILEKISSSEFQTERALSIGDVTLELTQDCPYKCEGCFREINNDEYLSLDKIKELLSELKSMGLMKISLSGGEVTANKTTTQKVKRVIELAISSQIKTIRLLTTGFNLSRLEELVDSGINELQISIDGNIDTHNSYKQSKNAYQRAIEAIKVCSQKGIKLTTNTVITKNNLYALSQTIDTLAEYGIDTIRINKVITDNQSLRLNPQEAKRLFEIVQSKQLVYGKRIINTYGDCINKINCVAGIAYAHIGTTGNVFPCDYVSQMIAGNINKSSFEDIWTNSEIISLFRKPKDVPNGCKDCNQRSFCIGNCLVEANNLKVERGCYYG